MHFLYSMPAVYRPHPFYWHVLMRLNMLKLKVHQVIQRLCSRVLQYYIRYSGYRVREVCALQSSTYYNTTYATVATECVRYVLYRALLSTVNLPVSIRNQKLF